MAGKPVIAITTRDKKEKDNRIFSNNESYYDYVQKSGGIACNVKAYTKRDAKRIADAMGGLMITGGEDINPKFYFRLDSGSFPISEDLDLSDFYLYEAFKAAGKPIFGICRGHQVIAVCEEIPLIQDIPTEMPGSMHDQTKLEPPIPRNQFMHRCTFTENTALFNIFGPEYGVNSFHHQAVQEVPKGFQLAATSQDGIIEAYESGNILSVQWHPERLLEDEKHLMLGKYFISLCEN